MQIPKKLHGSIKSVFYSCLILAVVTLFSAGANAQNIFLNDSQGMLTFGQYSYMESYSGPSAGLNYSFDGRTAIGISYGFSTENRQDFRSTRISGNMLVNKQSDGDLINFEVIPSFERKYNQVSEQQFSIFSFGTGISRDVSSVSDINFIPRASFAYLMSPSVGMTNYFSVGFDLNMGFDLSDNLKFIVDPGAIVRLDNGQSYSSITGGVLIH